MRLNIFRPSHCHVTPHVDASSRYLNSMSAGGPCQHPILQSTQSRHTKLSNRASSTPPILDRFSPYRHRSRVRSPPRCQKAVHGLFPLSYDTCMPEAVASNNPTQNTWALSPTVSSSARSPPWSQTIPNSIGAVSPTSSSFSSGQPSVQVASRVPDGQTR